MALIETYQGDSKTLILQFCQEDLITPMNVSGYLVRGVARLSYTSDTIIDTTVTGVSPYAITGTIFFPLTVSDTSHCPSDYLFDFRVYDLSSGSSTFPTDGLRILPTTVS